MWQNGYTNISQTNKCGYRWIISGPLVLIVVSVGVGILVAYGLIRILLESPK